MRRFSLAFAAVFAAFPLSTQAEELAETAARFGARQSVLSPALSPSGTKLLYIEPGSGSDETIVVVDLAGDGTPKAITTMNEGQARLNGCAWATEERIVCQTFGYINRAGVIIGFTRVLAMKADGTGATRLTPSTDFGTRGILQDGGDWLALDVPGEDNKILMTRRYLKESSENTRIFNDREGLGVDAVDVSNGRRKAIEPPNAMATGYIADETGRVRIVEVRDTTAAGFDGSDVRYLFRPAGSEKWGALSAVDQSGSVDRGFQPVAVDSAKNVAYGFDFENGFQALYTVALDGTGERERIMARSDVDVDALIRIGRKNRVVGASYATEKRLVEYFDPDLDKLARGMAAALPGKPLVSIVDANEDESKILLIASSDTDPGMLYLYDNGTRQLSELLPLRDPLAGRAMGQVKPITFPASDGTAIPGYLTLPPGSTGKNLPAVVLPHGGPEARDEWGFDWLAQFFAARGYAVLQPNFRGSAGYGEAWFGRNGYQQWPVAVGDINDAGRWLIEQGVADPVKLGIVGWSYGGYAALQSQVVDAGLFKAVAAIAPVTDLDVHRELSRPYTSYTLQDKRIGNGPHVASGSPARHAGKFKAPVLLVHGTLDSNVGVAQSKLMRDRLKDAGKQVDFLEFEGLDHGLVHSGARGIMLKRIGEFLDANLKR